VTSRRSALVVAWWATAGLAELTIAIVLLVYGEWYTIFGTAPATAVCVYFVLKERSRSRS
jgi:hypothetical protein